MNKNVTRLIWFFTTLCSLFLLLSLFSTLTGNGIRVYFCSDTLYFPSLYKDLFTDHNSIRGWHLNPSPYFFPDMVIYFLLMLCSGNFILASFIFSLFQYFAILLLAYYLFRSVTTGAPPVYASIPVMLIGLFILVALSSGDFMFSFYIVSNGYHAGAFVMALTALLLIIRYLKSRSGTAIWLVFIICSLSILSDRLFIVLWSLPMLSILALWREKKFRNRIAVILGADLLSVIVGLGAFKLLSISGYFSFDLPHRLMDFSNIGSSWKILAGQMREYLWATDFRSLILVISLLSYAGTIVILIRNLKKTKPSPYLTFYLLFSLLFIPLVFIMPVINGNYTGYDTLRYNIFVFYLSMINAGIVISEISGMVKRPAVVPLLSIVLVSSLFILSLGYSIVNFSPRGFTGYFSYCPNIVKCVDDAVEKENLKSGVSNYWDSKLITMFSKKGVRVLPVYDNLQPYEHVANLYWFTRKDAVINFFVLNHVADTSAYLGKVGTQGIRLNTGEAQIVKLPAFRYQEWPYKLEWLK
jgi:hypothetical protein